MKLSLFIYICLNLIFLQLLSLESTYIDSGINVLCVLGILFIGVAHGSIDNILYGIKTTKANILFIVKYVVVVLLLGCVWLVSPDFVLALFLLTSSYHFGQAQFVDYKIRFKGLTRLLYLFWGGVITSSIFYFNAEEALNLQEPRSIQLISYLHSQAFYFLACAIAGFMLVFSTLSWYHKLSIQAYLKELYLLFLITASFSTLPTFVALSLFFVCLHSLNSMLHEYKFCKQELEVNSIKQFVKLLIPLTVTSLLGLCVLFVIYSANIDFVFYALVVLPSCLTIPHAFVMEKFYKRSVNQSLATNTS